MSQLQPQLSSTPKRDHANYRSRQTYPNQSKQVNEATYWAEYYEKQIDESGNPVSYEWNNGILEVKPVSDYITFLSHFWFLKLLDQYLSENPCAKCISLEMGSKFELSDDEMVIRKPDIGIILNKNPIPLEEDDRHYHGCLDMCIETLSTSSQAEIERDTIQKKREYQTAGVQEYFIVTRQDDQEYAEYYHLNADGIYQPAQRDKDGVVHSKILPGFQWAMDDLYRRPTEKEMIGNPIYQGFVALNLQKSEKKAADAKQAAIKANQKENTAKQEASAAKQEASIAKQAASTAKQEASTAKQAASTAKQEASTAKQEASTAKQEASTAKQEASTAKQVASTAKQAENKAKQAANKAKQAAIIANQKVIAAKQETAKAQQIATEQKQKQQIELQLRLEAQQRAVDSARELTELKALLAKQKQSDS